MRAQWDLKRFVDTALFFNGPEQVLMRLVPPRRRAASDTIWDPTVQPPMLDFGPLDDVVMGGVSESSFEISTSRSSDTAGEESTVGVFAGTIRTENNGGFAGVRSRSLSPPLRLAAKSGIRMRVRGDGQRYKLIIRDSYDWNGIGPHSLCAQGPWGQARCRSHHDAPAHPFQIRIRWEAQPRFCGGAISAGIGQDRGILSGPPLDLNDTAEYLTV